MRDGQAGAGVLRVVAVAGPLARVGADGSVLPGLGWVGPVLAGPVLAGAVLARAALAGVLLADAVPERGGDECRAGRACRGGLPGQPGHPAQARIPGRDR